MSRTLWLAVCGTALGSASIFTGGAALAADLPSRITPPVFEAPAAPTWTGFYAGVNGGYSLDHVPTNLRHNLPNLRGGNASFSAYTERGPLAGGQVGYNMQFRDIPVVGRLPILNGYSFVDNIVLGAEVDADWADINGSNTSNGLGTPTTFGTRIKAFGTLRGRAGYSFGRLYLYVHSGISAGVVQAYYAGFGTSGSATIARFPLRPGTYGLGAEYKLSERWSVRAEYMYDYVAVKPTYFVLPDGGNFIFLSRASFHVARAALNYHFDLFGNTPIVARY